MLTHLPERESLCATVCRFINSLVEALGCCVIAHVAEQSQTGFNGVLVGPEDAGCAARSYFNLREASIESGSNEIRENILAKAVRGL